MEEKKKNGIGAYKTLILFAVMMVASVILVLVKPSDKDQGGSYVAGTYQGEATGMGKLTADVTVDETGKITGLVIDCSNETPGLGQVAAPNLQEAILAAGTIEGVDAVSGCTITSEAVFKAVSQALEQAAAGMTSNGDGSYSATATGISDITVTVTFDGSGKIVGLEADFSNETPGLGQVAGPKLVETILEKGTTEGVDAISGCTVTCNAVLKAIDECKEMAGK